MVYPAANVACVLSLLFFAAASSPQMTPKKHGKKTVWNLDGGASFVTDGGMPNGACFRMDGHVNAPDFFDGLKRIDDPDETTYERGSEVVTTFPEQLFVTFSLRDTPCSPYGQGVGKQVPLTKESVDMLRMGLFWKDGVTLRRIRHYERRTAVMAPVEPFDTAAAKDLPKRFVWHFAFEVPSKNVPITDSLVFVLVTPKGELAARVSARL